VIFKIIRENRLCPLCNTIEDEKHLIPLIFEAFSIKYNNLDKNDFFFILSPSTTVGNIGSFIKNSLELRTTKA
jgi:hypothetical protein